MKNETMRALEYTVKCLEKEWEQSKETKVSVEMDICEFRDCYRAIGQEIQEYVTLGEHMGEKLDFKECMAFSKTNYVRLRLARKLVAEINRMEKKQTVFGRLFLDKEEADVLKSIREE